MAFSSAELSKCLTNVIGPSLISDRNRLGYYDTGTVMTLRTNMQMHNKGLAEDFVCDTGGQNSHMQT